MPYIVDRVDSLRNPIPVIGKYPGATHVVMNTYHSRHGQVVAGGSEEDMQERLSAILADPKRLMPPVSVRLGEKHIRCEVRELGGALRMVCYVDRVPAFTLLAPLTTREDFNAAYGAALTIISGNQPAAQPPVLTLVSNPEPLLEAQVVQVGMLTWVAWLDGSDIKRRKFPSPEEADEFLFEVAFQLVFGNGHEGWEQLAKEVSGRSEYRLSREGELYCFKPMSEEKNTKLLGHGGRIFRCTLPDGSVQVSNNVWGSGRVPRCCRHLFDCPVCEIERVDERDFRRAA